MYRDLYRHTVWAATLAAAPYRRRLQRDEGFNARGQLRQWAAAEAWKGAWQSRLA